MFILYFYLETIMTLENKDENQPIDFSNTEYLRQITDYALATVENWDMARDDMCGDGIDYTSGQEEIIKILKVMMELPLQFEELRKELTGFIAERENFFKHVWKVADARNPRMNTIIAFIFIFTSFSVIKILPFPI